jgi:hypothetical protein
VPPLGVALTSQSLFSVAAGHGAGTGEQVSVTGVQVPLLHAKEQLPAYPTAQVPVSVLPLFATVRTQLFVVSDAHWAAQVLVTWLQVPLLHAKEQLPVYPNAHVPVSVLPLFVIARTQLFVVPAAQGAGAWQMPSVQTPLLQSVGCKHCSPSAQDGQAPPPQSTSVSLPSLMLSRQVAGEHVRGPGLHSVLMQSLLARQCLPSAQAVHQVPPQSVSVSSQFFTPSKQVAHGAAPVAS